MILIDINELERLKRYVKEYGDIDLGMKYVQSFHINNENGDYWLYLDWRNDFNYELNVYTIYPIFYTKTDKTFYYVCPFCHALHAVSAANFKPNIKYNIGCCANPKRSDKIYICFGFNEDGSMDIRQGKGRKFIPQKQCIKI